jgi:hypothetical protein
MNPYESPKYNEQPTESILGRIGSFLVGFCCCFNVIVYADMALDETSSMLFSVFCGLVFFVHLIFAIAFLIDAFSN